MSYSDRHRGIESEACACGLTYDRFRCASVASYKDAYHQIAWGRERTSRKAVLAFYAAAKREDWRMHLDTCEAREDDVSFDFGFNAADDSDIDFGGAPIARVAIVAPVEAPVSAGMPEPHGEPFGFGVNVAALDARIADAPAAAPCEPFGFGIDVAARDAAEGDPCISTVSRVGVPALGLASTTVARAARQSRPCIALLATRARRGQRPRYSVAWESSAATST